jgi:hypothetical protein
VPLRVSFRLHRPAFEELTAEARRRGSKNWHEGVMPGVPAGLPVRRWVGAFYVSEQEGRGLVQPGCRGLAGSLVDGLKPQEASPTCHAVVHAQRPARGGHRTR